MLDDEILCDLADSKCLDGCMNCIYDPGINAVENGRLLLDCENYTCPTKYFKCAGYYCIPYRNVCDGKWECPWGMEEQSLTCKRNKCPRLFKCHKSV